MEIEREIEKDLVRWKNSDFRRPLLIQGARQIGKTWMMKRFGEKYYENVAYFNFDSNDELSIEFKRTKQPGRILEILRLYSPVPIQAGKTLIIFDEIQECPEALNSLKYFCEEAPEYHIISAGSLLGVAIHHHKGFPVGKVDFIRMYPVSFCEFLNAMYPEVYAYLDNMEKIDLLPAIIEGKMWEAYRKYQICGGMPKAAVASLENSGLDRIKYEQREILTSYYLDFSKHAPTNVFPKIAAVWQSLPSQLSKENRKFIYKVVKEGARAREYEDALIWLREAALIYQICCVNRPGLPLSAYNDFSAFKIYLLDVGLLRELANLPPEIFTSDSTNFIEFKGALAENTVLENLLPVIDGMPRYWVSSGTAEVDFIIQDGLDIIPIEVKSAKNTSSKSLAVYIGKYRPKTAVVLSGKELSVKTDKDGTKILYLPLPLVSWLPRYLKLTDFMDPA
ncbi:MAG: ATP-binding protein [Muribaculaceae bacterium]|nr:ATP-binding protein [Muribaculaceae bacterium]